MADGLCTEDPIGDVIEKTASNASDNVVLCETIDSMTDSASEKVKDYLVESASGEIFNKLCTGDGIKHEGILEDDCRKKRCVDRYDSSESSDSGVAVLSCTDCSGSSTASSDITDPGSPFSTTSSHSEDSGSQPTKMPPTQVAHHPPWPWTADEGPPCKRSLLDKTATAFQKTLKTASTQQQQQPKKKPTVSATPFITKSNFVKIIVPSIPSPNDKLVNATIKKGDTTSRLQQGKITEYFKSQVKSNGIKKDLLNNMVKVTKTLIDQQTQFNSIKSQNIRKEPKKILPAKKIVQSKMKKIVPMTVPRKILPAPSNLTDKLTINDQLNNLAKFTPTVTLTALSFPPNYTYLHTKGPKPPETPIFVPQYATISNDKIPLPIINRSPCLNVIQPVQKLTTINNFNCVKLNATVVPIVKVNPMPSRLNTAPVNPPIIPNLSVETGIPTVLTAKPKIQECTAPLGVPSPPKQQQQQQQHQQHNDVNTVCTNTPLENVRNKYRIEENSRTEEPHRTEKCTREEIFRDETKEKSPTPDSDSGISISNKECLEVFVSETVVVEEEQKSPILSKPKTIRFPAKQADKDEGKSSQHSTDGQCRWAECNSCFDTSGALLEHLQVKHVISQATQEHYVCLWLGCKVHGRTSCSRSWLERHVLAHAGTKPFRCIVDGCGQRFNSQLMLERHVNSHFNSDGSPNNSVKKSPDNSCKLLKRNGKRIRFRRQPWSARMFDFIDAGIMEGLQYKLLLLTQKRTLGKINEPGDTVHLQSQVLAKRIETDGSVKFLLKWHPADIVADEWVSEKEYKPTKVVSIPHLKPSSKSALSPSLFPENQTQPRQKHRRKQISKRT
ncbi:uncharacterized protein LOC130900590 [Diorhabda carinulata]|uniref:uncharacterized protein LOC130900590 n=1 Tax=Diorhabda carinulata TaxID=1163345 RepID=UPI0025A1A9A9|nr:uncharacterized protein LOC130900590 [Diorhabda carinulata]